MITCQNCDNPMQDPFGRITERCGQCGWSVASVLNAEENGPIITEDDVRITDHSTDFFCPVCREENLHVATLGNTQVCCCRKCEGFLVDSQTLGTMIQSMRANYKGVDDQPHLMDSKALQSTLDCPTCSQTMFTHPYYGPGNAVINSCNLCQLSWFDAGELSELIRAPGVR